MNILQTISLKKAVLALALVALVATAGFLSTRAFFSDTETSAANVFAAGSLDLKIGIKGAGSDTNINTPVSIPGNQSLFVFENMIPGDMETGFFRLESTQDAYACIAANVTDTLENDHLAQEDAAGDGTPGAATGELQDYMEIAIWEGNTGYVDGLVGPEEVETLQIMSLADFANGDYYTLQDSATGDNPLLKNQQVQHEFAYCFGEITLNGTQLECDGGAFGADTNMAQTDSVLATIHFYAEQMQSNESFVCSSLSGSGGTPSGVVAGASLASTYDAPTSCTVTVQSGESIDAAITAASDGATICVDEGSYAPFTVNKDVTVVGLNNPTGPDAAVISGSTGNETTLVLVNTSGATVKGLKVSGGTYNVQFAGIGVINDTINISNITIDSNVVSDLAVNGNSNKGIQIFADENGVNRISGVTITNNIVDDLTATKGAYGIQIVNEVNNITVSNNSVSDFSGDWGAGVAVDANNPSAPTGVSITRNEITDHTGAADHSSVQVEVNAKSDQVAVNYNNLKNLIHGGSSALPAGEELNAENNWWGDTDPSNDVTNAPASNQTDYTPFASAAFSN